VILRLVREQLRSQWRYTAWSAALLAFALGLATYAMVTGATSLAQQDANYEFAPMEHTAVLDSVFGSSTDPALDQLENRLPFDEVQALITKASGEVPVDAAVTAIATAQGASDWLTIAAVATPVRWDRYLASGSAPGHGEVAISDSVARKLGIGVGGRLTLNSSDTRGPRQSMTFVVSGTLKSGTVAPYWTNLPADVYAPWSDAEDVALGLPSWRVSDEANGAVATLVQTVISWNGDSGTLAPYSTEGYWAPQSQGFSLYRALQNTDQRGYWSLMAAGLAVLGMMIAAFGMGRAQAEARTKWAATARVLGATRRTVAVSSLIETAIVSLAGIALGLAAGIAAVAANIAMLRARHPEALLPTGPSVPPLLILAGVGIGAAIAAAVAIVPAFWTARVAPIAALKPVTPVGEATVSRNVSLWWPVGIFGGGVLARSALFWISEGADRTDTDVITVLVWIAGAVIAVSAATLVIEGARGVVAGVAAILSRSRRPWLIAAGDGLAAHRRIFTFASLAMLAAAAAFTGAATANAEAHDYTAGHIGRGDPPLPSFSQWWDVELPGALLAGALAWVVGIITVVAVVVTVSSRATFAADAATRSALGLSANGERLASAARQWAVMGAASIAGALLGWLTPLALHLARAALSPSRLVYSWHWNVTVAVWGLAATGVVIAIALAVSLVGSLVVGLLARSGTPVEALRRAAH
jgi:hypothetical protein